MRRTKSPVVPKRLLAGHKIGPNEIFQPIMPDEELPDDYYVGDLPPENPSLGDIWYCPSEGKVFRFAYPNGEFSVGAQWELDPTLPKWVLADSGDAYGRIVPISALPEEERPKLTFEQTLQFMEQYLED